MRSKHNGFTIVELLIVIVVIAILAAITIVAYNGIQVRTKNSLRVSEANEWYKIVTLHATTYGDYGISGTSTSYCLGEGFKDYSGDGIGDCWDVVGGARTSMSGTFNVAMKRVGLLPNRTREPIIGDPAGYERVGPLIYITGGTTRIKYWLEGTDRKCPIGFFSWGDNRSFACDILLPALT